MKNFLFSVLFAGTVLSASAQQAQLALVTTPAKKVAGKVAAYKVQPEASKLEWLGKKVTGQHNGTISVKSGDLQVAGNKLTGGTVVVDMTSIKNTDLTDPDYNGKLLGHLKSDDFFSTEKFPTATFVITKVAPLKSADATGNNVTVSGNLTIKGITKPIAFPAKVNVANGTLTAVGTAMVDRTQYDIKYGSKSFFDSIGDKAIDNDFALTFNVTAKQ